MVTLSMTMPVHWYRPRQAGSTWAVVESVPPLQAARPRAQSRDRSKRGNVFMPFAFFCKDENSIILPTRTENVH